jgi:antirepressor protein
VEESGEGVQRVQALEPVEQEDIPFKSETIVAVRLEDGRICVVLRWVCETLHLDPQGQVQRIRRTATTAQELVRVRVQTPGGKQTMPAITLRGFSPWVLGINPSEVRSANQVEDERIRVLIIAYQEEAKDVLYEHFVNKRRLALPEPHAVVPDKLARPEEPGLEAGDEELTTYFEKLALWAQWMADRHAQRWRGKIEEWRGEVEARLEGNEAMMDLIPEIIERLGPETLTPQHHRQVQVFARQLHLATGQAYPTIYDNLKTAFAKPRIEDLLEDDWLQIERWFRVQIERVRKR